MTNLNYVDHLDLFGVPAKQIPCDTGEGAPTTATVGAVGCFYMDTLTGDVYKCVSVNGGEYGWVRLIQNTATIEPEYDDIPKVFFGSPLPQTKTDTVMSFRYISKTEDIRGYCKTKAQGNSSMSYPKKNQTVKLYKDSDCTEKLKVDFKGWGKQSKFCFKANWIDLTHARNVVSARLWGDVVKARSNYAEIPEELRTSPNQGAVDGFPVKVYAAGVYQGRYTINIPKDAWMANMDDDLDEHCILCGENYVSGCFRAEANIDESDWTDEIHEAAPGSIKARWNEAIRFVMNSADDEFVSGIGEFFDVPSLIDYYLFGLVSCGLDAFGKNQLYMTYDGQKWFATMYDMDSTWGLWWSGSYFVGSNYSRYEFQDFKDGGGNLLYIRLEKLFIDNIKERWNELKNDVLSVANIVNRFERFIDICPPWLTSEDYATTTASGAYTGIPLQDTNNIQQLRAYICDRHRYIDGFIASGNSVDYGDFVDLMDGVAVTHGIEIQHATGDEFATNNCKSTGHIDVSKYAGETAIMWYVDSPRIDFCRIVFYDENKNYVGEKENHHEPVQIPDNACTARVSIYGADATAQLAVVNSLYDEMTPVIGAYSPTTKQWNAADTYSCTVTCPASYGQIVAVAYLWGVFFMDETGVCIADHQMQSQNTIITVPENTANVSFCTGNAQVSDGSAKAGIAIAYASIR